MYNDEANELLLAYMRDQALSSSARNKIIYQKCVSSP